MFKTTINLFKNRKTIVPYCECHVAAQQFQKATTEAERDAAVELFKKSYEDLSK